jgi:hypothetical protein
MSIAFHPKWRYIVVYMLEGKRTMESMMSYYYTYPDYKERTRTGLDQIYTTDVINSGKLCVSHRGNLII